MQTDVILSDVTSCVCLHTLLHVVQSSCANQSLKPSQTFSYEQFWKLLRPFARSFTETHFSGYAKGSSYANSEDRVIVRRNEKNTVQRL